MLTEFAFTPSIFDEDAHDDKEAWRDQLRELGHSMFPRVSAWPIVVSDLYDGSWNQIANQTIKAIKDPNIRRLCEGILQNMRKILVSRPACGEWPEEEVLWGREAIQTTAIEPIERILCSISAKETLLDEYNMIRSFNEIEDAGFWHGISSDAYPQMVISKQIELLRKLCLHSDWVAFINPHTSTNELDFGLELLSNALKRPDGFVPISFEFHMQEPQGCRTERERLEKLQKVTNHVSRLIKKKLPPGGSVILYFWPSILERRLIAGNFRLDSLGEHKKSPRWGVSMNHVARGADENADPTNWSLLRPEDLDFWFRRFVIDDAAGKPTQIIVSPDN